MSAPPTPDGGSLFEYPLPVPTGTFYDQLGIGPEATTEEVRDATADLLGQIRAEQQEVNRRIERVYGVVEGLRAAIAAAEKPSTTGEGDADPAEARRALRPLEAKATSVDAEWPRLRARAKELADRTNEVNRMALQNPDSRRTYDRANPPLDLVRFAEEECQELYDNRYLLPRLRAEILAGLTREGETVRHASDLTREDFTDDFTPNDVLDGPTA